MASYDYDVIIIGGGAGAIVTARLLAKGKKSVALIEEHKLGGECPRYACIPIKALLASAHLYHQARNADQLGLRGSGVGFNYPSVKAWKDKAVRNTGVNETEKSLIEDGISVIHGSAHFVDAHTVTVGRARFSAQEFVIASGSEIAVPHVPGMSREDFLTYKDAINLSRPPKSLAIIGGGAVGLEFATLFGSFGSKVYIIEKASHLMSREDPLVGSTIKASLEKDYDITCIARTTLQSISKKGRKKHLILKSAGKLHAVVVDEILMATGKKPAVDIGLENAGVTYSPKGIAVDRHLHTSTRHIFAIGDCIGGYQFTHVSLYQGRVVAHNMLHKKMVNTDYRAIPRTVFTAPEIASVGPTPLQLKHLGIKVRSTAIDINMVSRSFASTKNSGFVKVTVDAKSGKLLSASIVAPHASEMVHELTLAIANGLTASDVANTIHAFPTWSEAIRVVCSKLART